MARAQRARAQEDVRLWLCSEQVHPNSTSLRGIPFVHKRERYNAAVEASEGVHKRRSPPYRMPPFRIQSVLQFFHELHHGRIALRLAKCHVGYVTRDIPSGYKH